MATRIMTSDLTPATTGLTTDAPTTGDPPAAAGYRRRGRPKSNFGPRLVSEILQLIEAGYGRSMVCTKLRIGPNRFRRILREKPHFAAAVRQAEAARSESCELQLLQLSQDETASPNVRLRASIAYLGRRERVEKARQQRRAQREARAREDAFQDEEEMTIRALAPRADRWSSTFHAVYGRGDLDSPTATAPPPAAEPAPTPIDSREPAVAARAEVPPAAHPTPADPSPAAVASPSTCAAAGATAPGPVPDGKAQDVTPCENAARPLDAPIAMPEAATRGHAPTRPAAVAPPATRPPTPTPQPRQNGRRHHRHIRQF